jgi:hypothetical protein
MARFVVGCMIGLVVGLALMTGAVLHFEAAKALAGSTPPPRASPLSLVPYVLLLGLAGGAVARAISLELPVLRYVVIGGSLGAGGGAFLAASAPFRQLWLTSPWSIPEQTVVIAGLGALAGLLLAGIDWIRRRE